MGKIFNLILHTAKKLNIFITYTANLIFIKYFMYDEILVSKMFSTPSMIFKIIIY